MVKQFLFEDRDSLFNALALACERHLSKALSTQGQASFMVSGGDTPAPLYQALSHSDLDWTNTHVALVDERWVDKDHEASNEALIHRCLLINEATQAPFTGMKTTAETALEGCAESEENYRQLPKPFTVSILGMGNDGHTASLFPHAQGLNEALAEDNDQLIAAINAHESEVTGPNTERMTLTLNGLLNSKRLIILLTGEEKLAVFKQALGDGDVEDMPIRAILRQNKAPVELYWAP
ncbi:6-phosphogluconolactonase [Methylomarinum sp. Ch1-1]|uniref:6-phosphogluconolactonase n=1 Tax=Methylomarinum roseum TaxID=3067653 RepID=A0AAU7NYS8_9GAMM|nr:6-phosphogluconolactonase [Methylomarinum sp. Ch1-1]MDP4521772.1 6-phosphogluconolactonase [Methylomarinum sp. Ch1-1]